ARACTSPGKPAGRDHFAGELAVALHREEHLPRGGGESGPLASGQAQPVMNPASRTRKDNTPLVSVQAIATLSHGACLRNSRQPHATPWTSTVGPIPRPGADGLPRRQARATRLRRQGMTGQEAVPGTTSPAAKRRLPFSCTVAQPGGLRIVLPERAC